MKQNCMVYDLLRFEDFSTFGFFIELRNSFVPSLRSEVKIKRNVPNIFFQKNFLMGSHTVINPASVLYLSKISFIWSLGNRYRIRNRKELETSRHANCLVSRQRGWGRCEASDNQSTSLQGWTKNSWKHYSRDQKDVGRKVQESSCR